METNDHDLLIRLHEKFDLFRDLVLEERKEAKEWREEHEKSDEEHFKTVNKKIESMNKYAASIALVAGGFGFLLTKFIDYFKG